MANLLCDGGVEALVVDEVHLLHDVHEAQRRDELRKSQRVAEMELIIREHGLVEERDADGDCACLRRTRARDSFLVSAIRACACSSQTIA